MSEQQDGIGPAAGAAEVPAQAVEQPAEATGARATGAAAMGASSTGFNALGAVAVGALALGAVAIGRLVIRRAVIRELRVGELDIGRLRVGRIEVTKPEHWPVTGEELMRRFLPASPYPGHLGIRLLDMGPGSATLGLPFAESLVTAGTVVHGGAVASLIDTAGMVAAWSGGEVPDKLRGSTVGLTVSYLAPADGEDLEATATVLRRGRTIVHVDVDVHGSSGAAVAKGLVTYKLG